VDTGEIVKTRPMTDGEKSKGLPLPLGPAILLSGTDPDVLAAKPGESNADAPPAAPEKADSSEVTPDGKECDNCHHLRTYHLDEDGKDCFCWQPDCDCEAFVTFSTTPPVEEAAGEQVETPIEAPPEAEPAPPEVENPLLCAHCGHPEGVHGTTRKRGCMRAECDCKGYVHPDPLGIANVEPEKREAEL